VPDLGHVGQISLQRDAPPTKLFDFGDDLARFLLRRAVMDDNVGALRRKPEGNGAAETFTRTSDQGYVAREWSIHWNETLA
jgi:hypothetical protein